jgi:hypothetical protein
VPARLWMCSRACGCARAPHAESTCAPTHDMISAQLVRACCRLHPHKHIYYAKRHHQMLQRNPLPPPPMHTHTHTHTRTHAFAAHTRTRHPLTHTHTHTLCRWTLPLFSPRCSLAHRARALRAPPSATPWRSVHASKRHNFTCVPRPHTCTCTTLPPKGHVAGGARPHVQVTVYYFTIFIQRMCDGCLIYLLHR